MLPIAMFLLQKDGQSLTGHDLFLKKVGSAFQNFIESAEKGCRGKCLEDLQSTTRYVTWSLHTKSKTSLKAMLGKVGASCAEVDKVDEMGAKNSEQSWLRSSEFIELHDA